jgi:hypothetical protein
MSNQAVPGQDQIAATYLQQLQALAVEISLAMDAIAGNALNDFQASVARQEMLCAVLANVAKTMQPTSGSATRQSLPFADPAIERNIHSTVAAVRQLNLQYAALLRHSGKSIAILASLCRSHTGQFEGAHGARLKRQTWSCEM